MNGTLGTAERVSRNRISVALDNGNLIEVPTDHYTALTMAKRLSQLTSMFADARPAAPCFLIRQQGKARGCSRDRAFAAPNVAIVKGRGGAIVRQFLDVTSDRHCVSAAPARVD